MPLVFLKIRRVNIIVVFRNIYKHFCKRYTSKEPNNFKISNNIYVEVT
jgi:hypothetical protein